MKPENDTALPSHYIGIGASAGGLEALQDFFSNTPNDTGASFIIVQHLSPDFKSMMPELLSKHTNMPMMIAASGQVLHANHIYLMPPRTNMLIQEGTLLLSENTIEGKVHLPIDIFLCSLAKDQKHKAVGIVLSGTGSDGTRGIKALKETGGLVVVQEPRSAKFDGMPVSAYNTGLADILLPPKEIGESLVKFINHPLIASDNRTLKSSLSDNVDLLAELFQLLKQQSSINFALYKASTVARRIERRMGINQISNLESYMRLLKDSPREVQILSKELLIGVTNFFRDNDAFSKIAEDIIPDIVRTAKEKGEGIRMWVAGCSTGEEAYSIAMLLDEEMRHQRLDCQTKIFATDVDEDAIAVASSGIYSEDIIHEVSLERLDRYFTKKDNHYSVNKHLRQMVIFATHNMIEDAPFSNINFISCRNVLIYFQHGAQKKVLSSLYFALQKNGYLFLGSSESLGDLHTHFRMIDERLKIFTRVSNARVPIGNASHLRDTVQSTQFDMVMSSITGPTRSERISVKNSLSKVHERIIKEYAPDCIILNDMFDAVHVYGDVSPYTQGVKEGKISNSIRDMVIEDLSVAITTALHRCEKTGDDVFYKNVTVKTNNNEERFIDLSVFLVKDGDLASSPQYYVIQFITQNTDNDTSKKPKKITFDPSEQTRQRIYDLEQELIKKQEHLQITIEELETTNEELQSANEELMSANEELQSTNEELQSVNEELYTVNSEYQEKIFELTEANDDLDSIIDATELGIIFLDRELTVRKYTPKSIDYFNIREQDIGRPFHHLSHTLIYDEILMDVGDTNKGNNIFQKEVTNKQGNALLLKIIPYQSKIRHDHSGILITITNISRLKFVENSLKIAQEQIRNSLLKDSDRFRGRITKRKNIEILLLDDSEADRKLIKNFISNQEDRKFSIVEHSNIESAIGHCEKQKFDVFLVDYDLGSGTAKDFSNRLKSNKNDTPIIVLSGYSEDGLDPDFLNNEAVDFLDKTTLTDKIIVNAIDYALERESVKNIFETIGETV